MLKFVTIFLIGLFPMVLLYDIFQPKDIVYATVIGVVSYMYSAIFVNSLIK
jgi:hypothetical protein